MPRSKLGTHRSRASDSSNDERVPRFSLYFKTTNARSELSAHLSRALGSSNDERVSSLLRQHYLLRAFNNDNDSRERFVTPVTAKVFRNFLSPRDGKKLLYNVCVLGAGCTLNSAVLPWENETGKSVLQDIVTCLIFMSPYYLLAVFPRKRLCPLPPKPGFGV